MKIDEFLIDLIEEQVIIDGRQLRKYAIQFEEWKKLAEEQQTTIKKLNHKVETQKAQIEYMEFHKPIRVDLCI